MPATGTKMARGLWAGSRACNERGSLGSDYRGRDAIPVICARLSLLPKLLQVSFRADAANLPLRGRGLGRAHSKIQTRAALAVLQR
jgi:hypothetical protein